MNKCVERERGRDRERERERETENKQRPDQSQGPSIDRSPPPQQNDESCRRFVQVCGAMAPTVCPIIPLPQSTYQPRSKKKRKGRVQNKLASDRSALLGTNHAQDMNFSPSLKVERGWVLCRRSGYLIRVDRILDDPKDIRLLSTSHIVASLSAPHHRIEPLTVYSRLHPKNK
jgi:hypothetical protein